MILYFKEVQQGLKDKMAQKGKKQCLMKKNIYIRSKCEGSVRSPRCVGYANNDMNYASTLFEL